MGDLWVSTLQKYTIAERQMQEDVSRAKIVLAVAVCLKAKVFCLVSLLFGSYISLSNVFL